MKCIALRENAVVYVRYLQNSCETQHPWTCFVKCCETIVEPDEAVAERLTSCLLCENCSVNCPSGIDIHELNAAARSYIYEKNPSLAKELVFDSLWTRPGLLRTSTKFLWGAQKTGLQSLARAIGLTKILPGDLPRAERMLTDVPVRSGRSMISEVNRARGERKYRVGYFLGCATDMFYPSVAATVDILTWHGCEVIVPRILNVVGSLILPTVKWKLPEVWQLIMLRF